jgi:hypothetical protein
MTYLARNTVKPDCNLVSQSLQAYLDLGSGKNCAAAEPQRDTYVGVLNPPVLEQNFEISGEPSQVLLYVQYILYKQNRVQE